MPESSRQPNVLVAGLWTWAYHQEAAARALEALGCSVTRFSYFDDLLTWSDQKKVPVARSAWRRLQRRLEWGPALWRINLRLRRVAVQAHPDVFFFYNTASIFPSTLRAIRRRLPGAALCQYANDDPFSDKARYLRWRHFLRCVPLCDTHYAFRPQNLEDYRAHGARRVHLLRAYYIPEEDRPLEPSQIEPRFQCDVVFAGHYENDARVEMLEDIARAGFRLNIFGAMWEQALPRLASDSPLRALYPIRSALGDQYRQAICGAKIALCFLSTLNRDTYTRRNFQIPAMGTMMLSQRTDDLATLFREGIEAEFFCDRGELLAKVRRYVADAPRRRAVAQAGQDRVRQDGHDVVSRMRFFLETCRSGFRT